MIRLMPIVQANESEPEKIEGSDDGEDSPLQGAGYGLYAIYGKPRSKPLEVQAREYWAQLPATTLHDKSMHMRKWEHDRTRKRGSAWGFR